MAGDYYFRASNRTGGTGTFSNPWLIPSGDAGAAVIDAKLRPKYLAGEVDVRTHWSSGEFRSWGKGTINPYVSDSDHGFQCLAGWQFNGASANGTAFKLIPKNASGYASLYPALLASLDASTEFQCRDFALDQNWDAWHAGTDAVGSTGIGGRLTSGLVIERCHFTGAGSDAIDGSGAIYGYSITQQARRVRIRDNWFHDFATNGGENAIAIGVSSNNHATATPQGATLEAIISGNYIEGDFFHAIGCQSGHLIVHDNIIAGSGSGFGGGYGIYCDTGFLYDGRYESNDISGCAYPIVFSTGWYHVASSQAAVTRCQFLKNIIDVTSTGMGIVAMNNTAGNRNNVEGDPLTDTFPSGLVSFEKNIIAENIIRYTSGTTGARYGIRIAAGGANSGNHVRDNIVDSELLTSVP